MNYRFLPLKSCFVLVFSAALGFVASAQEPAVSLPDSLPHPDSLSDLEVLEWVGKVTVAARELEAECSQKTAVAVGEREASEQNLKAAKQDTLTPKATLDSLAGILKNAKNAEKTAQKQQKQASQTRAFTEKVFSMDVANQRKNLRKAYRQVKELEAALHPPVEKPIAAILGAQGVADTTAALVVSADTSTATEKRKGKEKKNEKTGPKYKSYDPTADPMRTPPQRSCSLAVNTRDEFSGETYRETQREELFRFTNEAMKKILPPDQPHIICEAALSNKAGTVASLHLTFQIRDASARRAFGSLSKNSIAILKFLDGTTSTFYNLRSDDGTPDASGQVFTYRAQYALDPSVLKKIRKSELDKIRIAWSTGYEDYELQGIDVLLRQAKCLFE